VTDKTDPADLFDHALARLAREGPGKVLILQADEPFGGVAPEDVRLIILDDRKDRAAKGFRAAANAGVFEHVGLINGPRRAPESPAEACRFLKYVRDIVAQPPPAILPPELQVEALIVTNAVHRRHWGRELPRAYGRPAPSRG
jgi:hypothetical protein